MLGLLTPSDKTVEPFEPLHKERTPAGWLLYGQFLLTSLSDELPHALPELFILQHLVASQMAAYQLAQTVVLILLLLHQPHRYARQLPDGLRLAAADASSDKQEYILYLVEVLLLQLAIVARHQLYSPIQALYEIAAVRAVRHYQQLYPV